MRRLKDGLIVILIKSINSDTLKKTKYLSCRLDEKRTLELLTDFRNIKIMEYRHNEKRLIKVLKKSDFRLIGFWTAYPQIDI